MKERLLGAAVLIAAAVLLIPAFLDGPRAPETVSTKLELPVPDPANATRSGAESNRTHTVKIGQADSASDGEALPLIDEPQPEPETEPVLPAAVPPHHAEGGPAIKPDEPATTKPVAKRVPAVGWAVQVGSFTSESNARRLMEFLKDAGYPAFVVRNVVNGRVMFRVRVGPEADRLRAEALVDRLKSDRQQTQLVRHP